MNDKQTDCDIFRHTLSTGSVVEAGLCRETGNFGAKFLKDGVETLSFSLTPEAGDVLMQLWINLKYGEGIAEGKFYDVAFDMVEWVAPK